MTFAAWAAVAVVCLLGAITPGPSLAVVSRHALRGGRRPGLAAAWAHAFAIGFYAWASIVGLAALLATHRIAYEMLVTAGAGYLVYLGLSAFRATPAVDNTHTGGAVSAPGVVRAMRDGFLIAFLNPKVGIFFFAVFSQVVGGDASERPIVLAVLVCTALLIDGLWYSVVATALGARRVGAWLAGRADWVDRASGVVLLLLGGLGLVRQLLG